MMKYQIGHARAWPLIGYILSCLVSPLRRRQPSTSDPPFGGSQPHVALVSQPTTGGSRDHLSITIPPPQVDPSQCHAAALAFLCNHGLTSANCSTLFFMLNIDATHLEAATAMAGIGIAVDCHRSDAADSS